MKNVGLFVVVLILGVSSGFFLARIYLSQKERTVLSDQMPVEVKKGLVVGAPDEVFKDRAIGVLERNEGEAEEGTHKLIREGGPNQTAYLISSVINLDQFLGHKVEVWGQTYYSDKVGWLMDVGRLKVLE